MTWHGPVLDDEEHDLAAMLDRLAADADVVLADDPGTVASLTRQLAELGIWTLGTSETVGGAGASTRTTAVALEQLGRYWPALGWAAAQAHAAVDVLGADPRFADLVVGLHGGEQAVAVVNAGSAHVRLSRQGTRISGIVDRVDAAHETPWLLVLTGGDSALLLPPKAITCTPVQRTGLGGALTRSLAVDAEPGSASELSGVPAASAHRRLLLGAAAVAAGIAGTAADEAAVYAAARRQFGDVLTALPAVRQSLLEQASGAVTILSATMSAANDDIQAFAVARTACDQAVDVAAAALQTHGGYGYLTEYAAERRLRDAVSLRAAADIQGASLTAARQLAGLPLVSLLTEDAS